MPGSSTDSDQVDDDAEFVEQIKADAEAAPTVEDTIPKEEIDGKESRSPHLHNLQQRPDDGHRPHRGRNHRKGVRWYDHKEGSDKSSQFAAMRSAERMAELFFEEFDQVIVKYWERWKPIPNAPGATAAIRALTRAGVQV